MIVKKLRIETIDSIVDFFPSDTFPFPYNLIQETNRFGFQDENEYFIVNRYYNMVGYVDNKPVLSSFAHLYLNREDKVCIQLSRFNTNGEEIDHKRAKDLISLMLKEVEELASSINAHSITFEHISVQSDFKYSFPVGMHFLNIPHDVNLIVSEVVKENRFLEGDVRECYEIATDDIKEDNSIKYLQWDNHEDYEVYWHLYLNYNFNLSDRSFNLREEKNHFSPHYGLYSFKISENIQLCDRGDNMLHWLPDVYQLQKSLKVNRIWHQNLNSPDFINKIDTVKIFRIASKSGTIEKIIQALKHEIYKLKARGISKILIGNFSKNLFDQIKDEFQLIKQYETVLMERQL